MDKEEKVQFPEIAKQLLEAGKKDQEIRKIAVQRELTLKERNIGDKIDIDNLSLITRIIQEIGWPTITKVGRRASYIAWVIVIHQPDTKFQRMCLDLMKNEKDNIDPTNPAQLEDKILVHERRKQLYGTQFKKAKDGKYYIWPIEDKQNLDNRRLSVGFETMEMYLSKLPPFSKDLKNWTDDLSLFD